MWKVNLKLVGRSFVPFLFISFMKKQNLFSSSFRLAGLVRDQRSNRLVFFILLSIKADIFTTIELLQCSKLRRPKNNEKYKTAWRKLFPKHRKKYFEMLSIEIYAKVGWIIEMSISSPRKNCVRTIWTEKVTFWFHILTNPADISHSEAHFLSSRRVCVDLYKHEVIRGTLSMCGYINMYKYKPSRALLNGCSPLDLHPVWTKNRTF